jgi:putative Mn2+ efflux pump MntP
MFSLPEIINSLKPASSGPTLADSLISIIVVATISYTVGSVIGSKIIKEGDSEQEEVQPDKLGLWAQKWLDTIVFLVVCSYIVLAFIFYQYPINISLWIGSIIIIGLGYGLLFRLHSVRKLFKFIGSKIKVRYKQIEP